MRNELVLILGCHGVGKTYFAKNYAGVFNYDYIDTDFVNSKDFTRNLNIESLQQRYIDNCFNKIYENVKLGNNYVIDFSPANILPYLDYFNLKDLKSEFYERYSKFLNDFNKFYMKNYLIIKDDRMIEYLIKKRGRQSSLDFELASFKDINYLFRKLAKSIDNVTIIK